MEMGEQACRPPIGREAVEPAGLAEHADERRGAAFTFPVAQRVAQRPHGLGGVARACVRDGCEQEPVDVVRGDIERAADPSQGVFRRVLVERELAQGQQRPRCARVPLERFEDADFYALLQRCTNSVGQVCAAAPKVVRVLGDLVATS